MSYRKNWNMRSVPSFLEFWEHSFTNRGYNDPSTLYYSDAGRWKNIGVPQLKDGQNLLPMVGIGLTNLPKIWTKKLEKICHNAETIWKFPRFPLSRKNSFRVSVPILLQWAPCPCFLLFNHYFFKKLCFHIHLGLRFEFGPQRIRDLAFGCP